MLRLFIMNKSKVDEEMKYYKPDRTTRLRIMTPFSCICKAHPIILCASQNKAFRLHTYKLYNCLPLPTHYTHKLTSSALGLFRLSHHPLSESTRKREHCECTCHSATWIRSKFVCTWCQGMQCTQPSAQYTYFSRTHTMGRIMRKHIARATSGSTGNNCLV